MKYPVLRPKQQPHKVKICFHVMVVIIIFTFVFIPSQQDLRSCNLIFRGFYPLMSIGRICKKTFYKLNFIFNSIRQIPCITASKQLFYLFVIQLLPNKFMRSMT